VSARSVLTLNGGSSSIRFAFYDVGSHPRPLLHGKLEYDSKNTTLITYEPNGARPLHRDLKPSRHAPGQRLLDWIEAQPAFTAVVAVGHRLVHGLQHADAARVTPSLIRELKRASVYAPDHLPLELELIESISRRRSKLPQLACFDTAFHRAMPRIAKLLPIPRRYAKRGVERYGFHGLSYAYLMEELARVDSTAKRGRVILAHLGNGASLAAVHHGKSIDTSMGLTPASGLVMGTRTGDVDPGLMFQLARMEPMTLSRFQRMVNHESGLLGVSGTSADVRELLAIEKTDARAAEALGMFCYQARKWVGAFAAALGGLDTLVFAGGIGENAASLRGRICAALGFLGVELDRKRNAKHAPLISTDASRVKVRVIRTDEELMIARTVIRVLDLHPGPKAHAPRAPSSVRRRFLAR
jgi:acetate kinase